MENIVAENLEYAEKVAREFGYELTVEEYMNFYKYCLRKLEVIKKDKEYLPLLMKCEIEMYIQGRIINIRGRINKMMKGESLCVVSV